MVRILRGRMLNGGLLSHPSKASWRSTWTPCGRKYAMKSLRNETSETTKASGGALEQSYKPRGQFIEAQDGACCIAAICACPKFARTGAWGSRSTEEIRAVPRTNSPILACRSAFALYFRPSPLGLAGERFVEPAKRSLPLLPFTKQLRKRNERGANFAANRLGIALIPKKICSRFGKTTREWTR